MRLGPVKQGYRPKDHYFKKAKDQGLRARSAFKLDEIAARFRLFRAGHAVLDLGAAPGGFLQIIAGAVGPKGRVLGIDRVAIRPMGPPVKTAVMDVLADDFVRQLDALDPGPFDSVISDLAPKTSGVRTVDEARSLALASRALEVAEQKGRVDGSFVAKLFMGGDFESFRARLRQGYRDVKVVRPEATRGASVEVYLVGLGKRAGG